MQDTRENRITTHSTHTFTTLRPRTPSTLTKSSWFSIPTSSWPLPSPPSSQPLLLLSGTSRLGRLSKSLYFDHDDTLRWRERQERWHPWTHGLPRRSHDHCPEEGKRRCQPAQVPVAIRTRTSSGGDSQSPPSAIPWIVQGIIQAEPWGLWVSERVPRGHGCTRANVLLGKSKLASPLTSVNPWSTRERPTPFCRNSTMNHTADHTTWQSTDYKGTNQRPNQRPSEALRTSSKWTSSSRTRMYWN